MENPLIMENVSENTKYIYNRSINAHYNEIGKAK